MASTADILRLEVDKAHRLHGQDLQSVALTRIKIPRLVAQGRYSGLKRGFSRGFRGHAWRTSSASCV